MNGKSQPGGGEIKPQLQEALFDVGTGPVTSGAAVERILAAQHDAAEKAIWERKRTQAASARPKPKTAGYLAAAKALKQARKARGDRSQ